MGTVDITAEQLRDVLNYDCATGIFTWRVCKGPRAQVGTVAGSVNGKGYLHIKIDGVNHKAHRLAWLYHYGTLPSQLIDHMDRDKANNGIKNLRDVSQFVNMQNVEGLRKNNTSGFEGVYFHKQSGRWRAEIKISGRPKYLGAFLTPEAAHVARAAGKKVYKANVRDCPTAVPEIR